MKRKLLVTSLTILSACTLMACSHTTQKDTAASSTKETLNSYTREKAKVPADIEFNAEFLAKKLAVMWQDNQDVGKMTGARTKVAGLDAYQLQIVMKSGQYLITWIFQKGDKVYTISFEGDAETLKTFIPYIEDTWSLDGTGAVTD